MKVNFLAFMQNWITAKKAFLAFFCHYILWIERSEIEYLA
jgi:hypothetical protein